MKFDKINRRFFLQGAGGAFLSIPFLPSLVKANPNPNHKIFFHIGARNGIRRDHHHNSSSMIPANNQIGPNLKERIFSQSGNNGFGDLFNASLWNNYATYLNIYKGLDFIPRAGHSNFSLGRIFDNTVTIDNLMAKSPNFYTSIPALDVLCLNPVYENSRYSFNQYGELSAFKDPRAAYDRLFFAKNTADKQRNVSVVDAVLDDYNQLKNHPRISTVDKQRLDQHMSLMASLRTKLNLVQPPGCTIPAKPEYPNDFDTLVDTQIELAITAVQCGLTKIVNYTIPAIQKPGWEGSAWHTLTHYEKTIPNPVLLDISRWIVNTVFYKFVSRLRSIPHPAGGNYLDKSLVTLAWDTASGKMHDNWDMPVLTAGSADGWFKTGRLLDYSQTNGNEIPTGGAKYGIPYNRFFVSIMQAMGLTASEYLEPGKPGYGNYTIGDPSLMAEGGWDIGEIGNILPGIKA